jgi:putative acetyltransferase
MIEITKTDSKNPDFIELVKQLDAYLATTDGDEHAFYDQYNKIDNLKHVIVAYENGIAVGCGAIKEYAPNMMEVKRMYTSPLCRRKGIAGRVLYALERWTSALGYEKCVLETGRRQIEAVQFYNQKGYQVIPNYGQYANMANSICFEKRLTHKQFINTQQYD